MTRPLASEKIEQLELMFALAKGDAQVYRRLLAELEHRTVPRAVLLATKVRQALRPAPSLQPELFVSPPTGSTPPIAAESPAAKRPTVAPVQPPSAGPTIPLDEAYKLLKETAASTWEAIEQSRRRLVGLSHPDRTGTLSEADRARALEKAVLINAACMSIARGRRLAPASAGPTSSEDD